jgi:hypothetical protein
MCPSGPGRGCRAAPRPIPHQAKPQGRAEPGRGGRVGDLDRLSSRPASRGVQPGPGSPPRHAPAPGRRRPPGDAAPDQLLLQRRRPKGGGPGRGDSYACQRRVDHPGHYGLHAMRDNHSELDHARMWAEYESALQDYLALIRWAGDFGGDIDLEPPQRPNCSRPKVALEPGGRGTMLRWVASPGS